MKKPKCLMCGKTAIKEHLPFCSLRCKEEDLGKWLQGSYVIAGDETISEEDVNDDQPF